MCEKLQFQVRVGTQQSKRHHPSWQVYCKVTKFNSNAPSMICSLFESAFPSSKMLAYTTDIFSDADLFDLDLLASMYRQNEICVQKKSALITQLVSLPIEGTKTAVLRRELLSFPSWDEVVVNELRSSLSCVFSDTSSSEDELALTRKSCQQNNILARPTRRNRVMIDNTFNAGQSYSCVYSNKIKKSSTMLSGMKKVQDTRY